MSKVTQALTKDWEELIKTIPADLETSAKEYGAMNRIRQIKSGADLLRINLIYAIVLSLRQTAIWAVGLGLCDISRQAIEKRVLKSKEWLGYVLTVLLKDITETSEQAARLIRRLILCDTSSIARPSSPGTEWRLHLSWTPLRFQPAQVTMTDAKTGDGLAEAGLQASDLVVADRGYGVWSAIEVVLEKLAYFIIRLTWTNLPLDQPDGTPFDLIGWLKGLDAEQSWAEVSVVARADPQQRPLRLIGGRLPPDKADQARDRARRQARKKKRQPRPETLLVAGFCLVLTNLPAAPYAAASVLALYRLRWQIEWCFRRWKSLCRLTDLPAYPAPIAEPVLLAKLIIILLMQRRLGNWPWQQLWTATEPPLVASAVVKLTYDRLCELIRPSAVIDQLLADPTPFLRHLRSSRRGRPLQLAQAARRFAGLLPGLSPGPAG